MRTIKSIWLAGVVWAALGVAACSKHENFPSPLAVAPPPVPTNLVVAPAGGGYDLDWGIADPSVVDHYNVYFIASSFQPPELVGSAPTNSINVQVGFQLPGLVFAVSAVTTQNVEGEMVSAVTP